MAAVRHLRFLYFRKFLADMTGFPLELGTGARGQKLECMGLYQMVEKVLR